MGLQSRYGATIQPTSPFCLPPSASIVHGPYFVKVYKGLRSYRFPSECPGLLATLLLVRLRLHICSQPRSAPHSNS